MTHLYVRCGTKITPVFLPADEEATWLLLPSSIFLLSGGIVQPARKNLFLCLQGNRSDLRKPKKRISISINYSYGHRSLSQPQLI